MKVTITCNCGSSIKANLGKSKSTEKVCKSCGSRYRIYSNGKYEVLNAKNDRK